MGVKYVNARDLKDVNYNLKLLIQKYNHEHSSMVKDIDHTKKKINIIKQDIGLIKTGLINFEAHVKANKYMLGTILAIASIVGVIIGLGVAFS